MFVSGTFSCLDETKSHLLSRQSLMWCEGRRTCWVLEPCFVRRHLESIPIVICSVLNVHTESVCSVISFSFHISAQNREAGAHQHVFIKASTVCHQNLNNITTAETNVANSWRDVSFIYVGSFSIWPAGADVIAEHNRIFQCLSCIITSTRLWIHFSYQNTFRYLVSGT